MVFMLLLWYLRLDSKLISFTLTVEKLNHLKRPAAAPMKGWGTVPRSIRKRLDCRTTVVMSLLIKTGDWELLSKESLSRMRNLIKESQSRPFKGRAPSL